MELHIIPLRNALQVNMLR